MKKKKEHGSTRSDKKLNQVISEIVEQLRIQNRIHSIAVEALLDKKLAEEEKRDDTN